MENNTPEALIRELRKVTDKLNSLSAYLKTLNAQATAASEQRMYDFLEKLVDKVLKHKKS